jgi:putative cardiolipin synthase
LLAQHPGDCGLIALHDDGEAFAARMRLASLARHRLDLQSPLWRADRTGLLLLDALRQSAERGVKVRLLLDGHNPAALDGALVALNSHRNVRVRLFNAAASHRWPSLGVLADATHAGRRMHNRSFTADGQVSIVGGRNIGDEYLGGGDAGALTDLDMLVAGPVVDTIVHAFEDYWNCAAAQPFEHFVRGEGDPASLAALAVQARSDPAAAVHQRALRQSVVARQLDDGALPLLWGRARLSFDSPRAAPARAVPQRQVVARLRDAIGRPRRSLDVIAPYFMPTVAGAELLVALAHAGTAVRVLTNSLAATDAAAVHAGYAHWRPDLLRGGVRLFELRRDAAVAVSTLPGRPVAIGGTSAGLHAKTFVADGTRLFVGSFNFDPRAARLNTDMGLVVESADLAQHVLAAFDAQVAAHAWEVTLAPDGRLAWVGVQDGVPRHATHEPDADVWRRMLAGGLARLPIDGLL